MPREECIGHLSIYAALAMANWQPTERRQRPVAGNGSIVRPKPAIRRALQQSVPSGSQARSEKRVYQQVKHGRPLGVVGVDTDSRNVHPGRSRWFKWLLDTSTLAQLMPLKAGASIPLLTFHSDGLKEITAA